MIRRRLAALFCSAAALTGAAACSSSSSVAARPRSDARLAIIEPTVDTTVHGTLEVKLRLTGGEVVGTTSGPLSSDQGHIHVSLDGALVTMAYGLRQRIPGVKPGQHTLQAEFVATDHKPFPNRVIAAVVFVAT